MSSVEESFLVFSKRYFFVKILRKKICPQLAMVIKEYKKMRTKIFTGLFAFIVTVVALSMGSTSVSAQTSKGAVAGTVTDPNGAVVAGATIDVVNNATNQKRSTISNDAGNYRID